MGLSLAFPPAAPFVLLAAGAPAIASVGYAMAKAVKTTIVHQEELSETVQPLLSEAPPETRVGDYRDTRREGKAEEREKPTTQAKFILMVWILVVFALAVLFVFLKWVPPRGLTDTCPANAFSDAGPAQCQCLPGFKGQIAWDGHTFSGECTPTNCPALSTRCTECEYAVPEDGMQCQCFEGARGGVFWHTNGWRGECGCPETMRDPQ